MDVVRRSLLALLLAAGVLPVNACDIDHWQPYIDEASSRYGIPGTWIRAVLRAESGGCTQLLGRPIVSHAGAMGLMQLMPATWAELRQRHGFGNDPHDPRENILAGSAYLAEMHRLFGTPGAFAAYHAGPGLYAAHLRHGGPLPVETQRYVAAVSAEVGRAAPAHDKSGERADLLFAVDVRGRAPLDVDDAPPGDGGLFVRLRRDRGMAASAASPEANHTQP